MPPPPTILITGAAHRLGAATARALHSRGCNLIIHYGRSATAAGALATELNGYRAGSAVTVAADLSDDAAIAALAKRALEPWGRLDCLINNASSFYPTPLAEATPRQWDELMSSNLRAPFFLSRALAPALLDSAGTIVNLADINGRQPMPGYPVYNIAKAGNIMLTKTLARELAPRVRVNGIAPGAILWPEGDAGFNADTRQRLLAKIPLGRMGTADEIAALAVLLALEPGYLSGQVIAVDGGLGLAGGYD
ncbi:MAG: pteridine reductase [Bacteroidales bacterium]|nr:pteridine reductase [Bacteroidales bacterium]